MGVQLVVPSEPSTSMRPRRLGASDVMCINLRRRPDRRASFTALFSRDAPRTLERLQFIDGVDGAALTASDLSAATALRKHTPPYFDEQALRKMQRLDGQPTVVSHPEGHFSYETRLLTRGAVGCALSHLHLWERVAEHADPHHSAVVFEDDVERLAPDFDEQLARTAATLATLSREQELLWDVCYLGHFARPPGARPTVGEGPPPAPGLRRLVGGVYGLFAYVISRRGARNLLKWRQRGRSSVALLPLAAQIDCALAERREQGLALLVADPPLAHCDQARWSSDTDVQVVGHAERPNRTRARREEKRTFCSVARTRSRSAGERRGRSLCAATLLVA